MKLKYYLIFLFLLLLPAGVLAYSVHAKNLGAKAEKTIGLNYYYGRNGFKQNYSKAVYWFRKAAAQRNAFAQCNLGYAYWFGRGVKQNYYKAVYWYKKAATQGNTYAQLNFGMAYLIGKGVKQSYSKAVYWLHKSAAQGNKNARTLLNKIEQR